MKRTIFTVTAALLIAAPAMAQKVNIDYAHDFDFEGIKTFTYVDTPDSNAENPLMAERIELVCTDRGKHPARLLGRAAAAARGVDLEQVARHGRQGRTGQRGVEIGFHAIRGGDVVGEHTVWLAGDGERLLLTVDTPQGAALATFTEKVAEIDLLVEEGDGVTLGLRGYEPFVNNPVIQGVRKSAAPPAAETPPAGKTPPAGEAQPAEEVPPAGEAGPAEETPPAELEEWPGAAEDG